MKNKLFVLLTVILSSGNAQITNGDLEAWQDHTLFKNPNAFYTFDNLFFLGAESTQRTTDSHSGQYAAVVQNAQMPSGYVYSGLLVYGSYVSTTQQTSTFGWPCVERPDIFKFWYKYQPAGHDTAFAIMYLTKWKGVNTIVGTASVHITQSNSQYALAEIPIAYFSTEVPDTIFLGFMLINGDSLNPGTKLYVDDINIGGFTGLESRSPENGSRVYPNPFDEEIVVKAAMPGEIRLCDALGREILNQVIPAGSIPVDTRNIPAGIYFMRCTVAEKTTVFKLIKN